MSDGKYRAFVRRHGARALGVVLVELLLAAGAAAADFRCAELKPSDTREPAYKRVPGQVRCEGFYDQHVSQPFIELVSLTTGTPVPQDGSALQITASRKLAAQLVVHPLRPAPFYRVDALIEPGQTLRWDPATMLDATGLRLRDLGFLALAQPPRDGTMTLLPLAFAGAATSPSALQAVLRASVGVASFSWRRQRLDGSDDGAGAWREIPGPPRFAWERVPLPLEMPADGSGLRVDVQALDTAGKLLPLLRFIVSGPADAGS